MTENLYDIAEKLGVRTVEDMHTPGLLGGYHEPTGTIVLASGMTARQYRSVLAHELAHALHKDTHEECNSALERKRDLQAAEWLIDPEEFRRVVTAYPGHAETIAYHLDVTVDLVHAYARAHLPAGAL